MKFRERGKIDFPLALTIFGLSIFGLLMLYSASADLSRYQTGNPADSTYFLIRQLIAFGIGIVAWLFFQQIDYHIYAKRRWIWPVATLVLLLSVTVLSKGSVNGANRWVGFAGQTLQPSELAKITLILFLADWFSGSHKDIQSWKKSFLPFLVVLALMSFLLLQQHDLGTLSVMLSISLVMYIVSGVDLSKIVATVASLLTIAWLAIKIEPYRVQRVLTFLNSSSSLQGSGYQINQAKIAIGSGGWFGRGFLKGVEKNGFLPEAHTDSIFAVIVEELGFLRSAMIVLVYAFIAWRGMRIARKSPDHFGMLLATGITTWFIAQAMINISAMVSLIPLTGVPLPFVSYGRTALVALMAATGILLNVSRFSTKD